MIPCLNELIKILLKIFSSILDVENRTVLVSLLQSTRPGATQGPRNVFNTLAILSNFPTRKKKCPQSYRKKLSYFFCLITFWRFFFSSSITFNTLKINTKKGVEILVKNLHTFTIGKIYKKKFNNIFGYQITDWRKIFLRSK